MMARGRESTKNTTAVLELAAVGRPIPRKNNKLGEMEKIVSVFKVTK